MVELTIDEVIKYLEQRPSWVGGPTAIAVCDLCIRALKDMKERELAKKFCGNCGAAVMLSECGLCCAISGVLGLAQNQQVDPERPGCVQWREKSNEL